MRVLLPLSLVLGLLPVGAAFGVESREIVEEFEVAPEQAIRINLSIAEVRIETARGKRVKAELTLRCRWNREDCEEALEEIELVARPSRRRLRLELQGLPRWHHSKLETQAVFIIPVTSALEIDLDVGELEIDGTEQDVLVDLGVGEVDVWVKGDTLGTANLDVGVGEAELSGTGARVQGRRTFFVGSEIFWDDGSGEAHLDIEVGVGEILVRLE